MAATAEALAPEERSRRPDLRVLPGGKAEQRVLARRRLMVLGAVAMLAFGAGLSAASLGPGEAAGEAAEGAPHAGASIREPEATVVVAPGDTVWDLAREHLPEGVRAGDYVAEILTANDLDPTALQPGTVVRLPSGS